MKGIKSQHQANPNKPRHPIRGSVTLCAKYCLAIRRLSKKETVREKESERKKNKTKQKRERERERENETAKERLGNKQDDTAEGLDGRESVATP